MASTAAPDSAESSRRQSADAGLERRAAILERRFDALLADVHLPFLEVRLYRKYYLATRSEKRLDDLEKLLAAMQQHRAHTLAVLKLVHEREGVVTEIREKADEFAERKAATLDVQTRVLQLLHAHQEVTVRLVEAIQAWRARLTRPYPFHWQGVNYLRKVLADCEGIDACALRTVLPLRLSLYPLCSNITSLALFGTSKDGKAKPPTAEEKAQRARIVDTEKYLFAEAEAQAKVMRDLNAISAAGYFVPLLNLPEIIPKCSSGIRVSQRAWSKQLSDAISASAQTDPRCCATPATANDDDVRTVARCASVSAESPRHVAQMSPSDSQWLAGRTPQKIPLGETEVTKRLAFLQKAVDALRSTIAAYQFRGAAGLRREYHHGQRVIAANAETVARDALLRAEMGARNALITQRLHIHSVAYTPAPPRPTHRAPAPCQTPTPTSPTASSGSTEVSTPEDTPSPVTSVSRAAARRQRGATGVVVEEDTWDDSMQSS